MNSRGNVGNESRSPSSALLTLLFATFLATAAIVIEWYPAEIDHTGQFIWVGKVRSILNHNDVFRDQQRINFEHGHKELVSIRQRVRRYPHTEAARRNETRLINPPANVSVSFPPAESFWWIYASFAAPCLSIALLNLLSPLVLLRLNMGPEVSRSYSRRVRRRLANIAFIGIFWQAAAIIVFSIYDVIIAPLLGTPTLHMRVFGFEVLGGLIYFQFVLMLAMDLKPAKLFFSNTSMIRLNPRLGFSDCDNVGGFHPGRCRKLGPPVVKNKISLKPLSSNPTR